MKLSKASTNPQYVIMTQESLKKIKTKKDKTIHIIQFVNLPEIDQVHMRKTIIPFRRQCREGF